MITTIATQTALLVIPFRLLDPPSFASSALFPYGHIARTTRPKFDYDALRILTVGPRFAPLINAAKIPKPRYYTVQISRSVRDEHQVHLC